MCGLWAKRMGGLEQNQPQLQIRHAKHPQISTTQSANTSWMPFDQSAMLAPSGEHAGFWSSSTMHCHQQPLLPVCQSPTLPAMENGLQNAPAGLST